MFAMILVSGIHFVEWMAITAVVCGALGYAFRGKIHGAIGQAGAAAAGTATKVAGDLGAASKKV